MGRNVVFMIDMIHVAKGNSADIDTLTNLLLKCFFDLTAREMHIAWGNPCQNAYHAYHLNA
jgi:hypothetical protein